MINENINFKLYFVAQGGSQADLDINVHAKRGPDGREASFGWQNNQNGFGILNGLGNIATSMFNPNGHDDSNGAPAKSFQATENSAPSNQAPNLLNSLSPFNFVSGLMGGVQKATNSIVTNTIGQMPRCNSPTAHELIYQIETRNFENLSPEMSRYLADRNLEIEVAKFIKRHPNQTPENLMKIWDSEHPAEHSKQSQHPQRPTKSTQFQLNMQPTRKLTQPGQNSHHIAQHPHQTTGTKYVQPTGAGNTMQQSHPNSFGMPNDELRRLMFASMPKPDPNQQTAQPQSQQTNQPQPRTGLFSLNVNRGGPISNDQQPPVDSNNNANTGRGLSVNFEASRPQQNANDAPDHPIAAFSANFGKAAGQFMENGSKLIANAVNGVARNFHNRFAPKPFDIKLTAQRGSNGSA